MEEACSRALEQFQATAQWEPAAAQAADQLLEHVVQRLSPDRAAWEQRNAAIQRINAVLRSMPDFLPDHIRYGRGAGGGSSGSGEQCLAQLLLFGSFCSGLWHRGSDLDLTITGRWRNRQGQLLDMSTMQSRDLEDMLNRVLRALVSAGVAAATAAQPPQVIRARVPLIVFADRDSGIAVDISVSNHGGAFKSIFTRELTQFDPRVTSLYRLVKLWTEAHGLNDSKCGTLNSWTITQLVLFHLQTCRPAVLPPLWQLFHSEPSSSTGPRPLEQQQDAAAAEQQTPRADSSSRNSSTTSSSSRGRSRSNPRQVFGRQSGAPYEFLDVCAAERQRLQPLYNSSSKDASNRPLPLLAGFLVRFREVFLAWRQPHNRSVRLSTWFGSWCDSDGDSGQQPWTKRYLALVEDPFDSSDNTARTLGTNERNDGGCMLLLEALDRAAAAISQLHSLEDVDRLARALFKQTLQDAQQPGYDPIAIMQQQQEQWRQQQLQQRLRQEAAAAAGVLF